VNLKGCRPGDQDLVSTGKLYTGLADGLLGVGAAAVGTAAVLFFVLGPKKQPAAQAQQKPAASVRVVPTGTGVMVLGKF
jgi:hypothetical protein